MVDDVTEERHRRHQPTGRLLGGVGGRAFLEATVLAIRPSAI